MGNWAFRRAGSDWRISRGKRRDISRLPLRNTCEQEKASREKKLEALYQLGFAEKSN